jgi:hypothetical protein
MTLDRLLKLIRKARVSLGVGLLLVAACTTTPAPNSDSSSDGGGTASDAECKVNDDCIGSDAAELAGKAKCPVPEFFCKKGQCEAKCAEACSEGDACVEGVCSTSTPTAPTTPGSHCRTRAIACAGPEDCPTSPPMGYGGEAGEWSCEDHECAYPGVEYPTK